MSADKDAAHQRTTIVSCRSRTVWGTLFVFTVLGRKQRINLL